MKSEVRATLLILALVIPGAAAPATPSDTQGWGPALNWTDRGRVDRVGLKFCVPGRCNENVLVITETSAGEPSAGGAGETTMETLELTDIEELDEMSLAQVRASAMEMERNAYQRSKTVYAQTAAAERAPAVNSRE